MVTILSIFISIGGMMAHKMRNNHILRFAIVTVFTMLICMIQFAPAHAAPAKKATIDPNAYPAADEKEWGQLLWNLKLANQDIADFTNFQSVDEQGVSACRYTIAFSAYFLAAEQYHKFPAWRNTIQNAFDRINNKMLEKKVWEYWVRESRGITKFEPNMDRPYQENKDPVSLGNIMYSGHLGQMINLYQMLYNDKKWDKPGSIVFKWDSSTKFIYDNKSLQEVMFLQMITNPVPGIECERNAIFPVCNLHPMLSWMLYDKTHGTRYFASAHPLFDEFFVSKFINPKNHSLGIIYLIKQGSVFSSWNPSYCNKMDPMIKEMVKMGANFDSASIDGWIGTFMHAWNPKLVEKLWPYMKNSQIKKNKDGSDVLRSDSFAPDAYYGFFMMAVAEMGDESLKKSLFKAIDNIMAPVWIDGTYHYPFMDKVATVNLGADDSEKKHVKETPETQVLDGKGGLCCKTMVVKGQGILHNMKTFPQHADLTDRQIGIARALPKNGMWTMHNKPFDAMHFNEPAITDVDITKLSLKRAIYDRSKLALIVSTMPAKAAADCGFKIINLNPTKKCQLFIDGKKTADISGVKEYDIKVNNAKAHDIILKQI
jgi:hypothetical protein